MSFKATFQGQQYTDVMAYALAVEAFEKQVEADKAAREGVGPLAISVGANGKLNVKPTNVIRYGTFPLLAVNRDTMRLLIAHWPVIVAAFESSIGQLTDKVSEMTDWRKSKGKGEPKDLGPTGF